MGVVIMQARFASTVRQVLFSTQRSYALQVTVSPTQTTNTRIIPHTSQELNDLVGNSDLLELMKSSAPSAGGAQLVYGAQQSKPGRQLVVTMDDKKPLDGPGFRALIHKSIQQLRTHKITEASLHMGDFALPDVSVPQYVDHVARTAALSSYEWSQYKKSKNELFRHLELVGDSLQTEEVSMGLADADAITSGTLFARDLGNEQADDMNPEKVEEVARALAGENDQFSVRVVKGKELEELGMNMLMAVGQASRWEPRLIFLEYRPNASDDTMPTVLLGKGITFDTGGLNLKPTNFIEEMHMDMCGAATVLGTAKAVSKLQMKQNIVFAVSVAENAISEHAYKPGAILKSYSGKTVHVGNTDAEGRLVLADALTYAQEIYKPKTVVDVATLTGACVVALGEYAAGLFSNEKQLQTAICQAADDVLERCWPMPIFPEHTEELESTVADTCSTGKGRYGGASTAAAFLQKFVNEGVQWAHMDVAGPAMYSAARSYMPKGSTGLGVQTLVRFLQQNAPAK